MSPKVFASREEAERFVGLYGGEIRHVPGQSQDIKGVDYDALGKLLSQPKWANLSQWATEAAPSGYSPAEAVTWLAAWHDTDGRNYVIRLTSPRSRKWLGELPNAAQLLRVWADNCPVLVKRYTVSKVYTYPEEWVVTGYQSTEPEPFGGDDLYNSTN